MSHIRVAAVAGWGFGLWLFGYVLGFVVFALVPPAQIGWYVMPFGVAATWLVLWKRMTPATLGEALFIGVAWTVIAIVCDYVFLVKLLAPPDGYYKLDVWLYYLFTFLLPIAAALLDRRAPAKTRIDA